MKKHYAINEKYKKYTDSLLNIQNHFQNSSNSIHKARNELKTITFGTLNTVVKSFKVPNIINKIVYTFFRDSKAKKSYEYSLRIGDFTPEPLGYIEFYKHGLLDESYFIAQEFAYDFTIREPLLDKNFPNREEIFKAFAHFTLKLHNNNIFHNDYSPGNILIKKEKDTYIFKIVDINRMKFIPLSQEQRAENFSKLWASDDILTLIASEYAKNFQVDNTFIQKVLFYSNKHKKIKNFKKRLKGKPVND